MLLCCEPSLGNFLKEHPLPEGEQQMLLICTMCGASC